MTKKTSFSIKNSIKDEPLLHNHKPQTKIICQQKTKPLNDKKFSFIFKHHNPKPLTKIIPAQNPKP